MKKIAITTTSFAKGDARPMEILKKAGLEIVANKLGRKLSKDETVELCKGCSAILAGTESYDKDVISKLPGLEVISRCGVGMDNVNLDAAKAFGIKVLNTPDAPTNAVAELTIALILDVLRRVSMMDAKVRSGGWEKVMGNLLSGKKVGIIGFGRIGKKVASLLSPFGCEILYTDMIPADKGGKYKRVPLEELLKSSDIVSIHVSSGGSIIGPKEFGLMKKGSFLVNVSRGGVVDEDALYSALKEGRISGAAVDVFNAEPYKGRLTELDNVVLTPHVGSYASESRVAMEIEAAENLIKSLKGAE